MRALTGDELLGRKRMLQDRETMRFDEGPMEEEECVAWLQRQLCRYENLGFGPMAVCLRGQREMMGQCGLSLQQGPEGDYLEVGYLLNRAFWHRGYATEAARAVRDHAFEAMNAPSVYSFIREGNIASMNVAIRNGMTIRGAFTKH